MAKIISISTNKATEDVSADIRVSGTQEEINKILDSVARTVAAQDNPKRRLP